MKHFQPCSLCGNCQSYRKSVKIDEKVVEPADCSNKEEKPVRKDIGNGKEKKQIWACAGFSQRNKKDKRMKNRMKKWERQFSY